MPGMNASYRNAIADHGAGLITHIGLVNSGGDGVGDRESVTWTEADDGLIRPSADITFSVPGDSTVAGWRGYSASSGGTEYGGKALTPESFAEAGQYTLLAAQTSISHEADE